MYICVNFRDKILLRGEECKTRENLNLSEKGQNGKLPLVYKLQNWNFSRSRMTKRTSPLDSLPRKILLNSVTVGFSFFLERWVPDGPQIEIFKKISKVENKLRKVYLK